MGDWNLALHQKIPALKKPNYDKIDQTWDKFLEDLERRVKAVESEKKTEMMKLFLLEKQRLSDIRDEIKDKVDETITQVSDGASRVHRSIIKSLREKWEPTFKKAKKEKGK